MNAYKIVAGLIVAAMIGVATVPMLVVADLIGGGDGWGLCRSGLASCRTSYFSGLELAAILSVALFGLTALWRLVRRLERAAARRQERRVSGQVTPPRPQTPRLPPG